MFDRETRSYVVDRIPRPPEAKPVFERDFHGRMSIVGHELKVGCSKCFNQTIVRWYRAYSDSVVENFRDENHPELTAVTVARAMQEVASRAETEALAARRREAEAKEEAARAERLFRQIQIKRSERRKRKERNRRAKGKR